MANYASEKYHPGWDFSHIMDPSVKCAFCLKSDTPMLVRGGQNVGVCETCAVIAHYLWRKAPGEVPPEYPESAKTEVSKVYVLIPKLGKTNVTFAPDGSEVHSPADPLLPSSYEFVMQVNEEGSLDLPGVTVIPGETLRMAAERALGLLKVLTWPIPSFIEPLYTAYTPRGRLAAVMLVTAWRLVDEDAVVDGLEWRKWPLSNKSTPMGGFYKALEPIWAMRLNQHYQQRSMHTEKISVRVFGSGSKYIALQQGLRMKKPDLDTSLAEIMKRLMSDDEKVVEKLIAEHEIFSRTLQAEKKEAAMATVDASVVEPTAMAKLARGEQLHVKGDRSARSEFAAVVEGDAGDISGSSETAKVVLDAPVDDLEEEEENSEGGLEDDLEEEQPEVATSSDPLPDGLVRRGKDLSMKREGS
jgi:hypothetical protein